MANEYDLNKVDNDTWFDGDIKTVVEGIIYNSEQVSNIMDDYDISYLGNKLSHYSLRISGYAWPQTNTGFNSTGGTGEIDAFEYYKADNNTFTLTSYPLALSSSSSQVLVMPHYEIYELYDECDDSSVSGTNWVRYSGTATATEDSEKLTLEGNSSPTKYRTSAITSGLYVLNFYLGGGGNNNGGGTASIIMTDGTNDVAIVTASGDYSNSTIIHGTMTLRIDITNEKVLYELKGIEYSGGLPGKRIHRQGVVDISSLSTNYYLGFVADDNPPDSAGAQVYIYSLRKGKINPSTTITTSVSRDGSTYTDFTKPIFLSTASGSTITLRATGTVAANEVLVFKGWDIKELT